MSPRMFRATCGAFSTRVKEQNPVGQLALQQEDILVRLSGRFAVPVQAPPFPPSPLRTLFQGPISETVFLS